MGLYLSPPFDAWYKRKPKTLVLSGIGGGAVLVSTVGIFRQEFLGLRSEMAEQVK